MKRFQKLMALLLTAAMLTTTALPAVAEDVTPSISTPEITEAAELTATPKPTETPEPTATPESTEAPESTATLESTETPESTATPEATEAPAPTVTPEATEAPESTATPEPMDIPTIEPTAEATQKPADSIEPEPVETATAAPTDEAEATQKPADSTEPVETVTAAPSGETAPSTEATPEPTPEPVLTSITVVPDVQQIFVGGSAQLRTELNEDAPEVEITWTSSDDTIATVNQEGIVTAVSAGTAVITASCGEISGTCDITVRQVALELSLSAEADSLYTGETVNIACTFGPEDAEAPALQWSVSGDGEAELEPDAESFSCDVTGTAPGTVTITATATTAAGTVLTKTYTLTINRACERVTIDDIEVALELDVGAKADLNAVCIPGDTTDTLTWESSDPSVATVDANGTVHAISVGIAIITARCGNGEPASRSVIVEQYPTSVTLYNQTISMTVNYNAVTDTYTPGARLYTKLSPDTVTRGELAYFTSDPSIAYADEDGYIVALKTGSCVIGVRTENGKYAQCAVTDVAAGKAVTAVKLSKTSLTLIKTKTATLTAKLTPSKPANKTVYWYSEDPSIATVSSKGVVTGVSAGTCKVYAVASNGIQTACTVTITPLAVTSVKLSATKKTISIGSETTLTATVLPAKADNTGFRYSSSNPAVAAIDENGVITAKAIGTTVITVQSGNGKKATCKLTVTGVTATLSTTKATLSIGAQGTLTYKLSSTDERYQGVTWRSSNPAVATVDENGTVTGLKAGTVSIICTTATGNTTTCKVTVKAMTIKLSRTSASLLVNGSGLLTATVSATLDAYKTVTWSSSNTSVCTVEDGVVTAIGAGTATITATAVNGAKATCKVTVNSVKLISLKLFNPYGTFSVGGTYLLNRTYTPANATNAAVTWTSSNTRVASIDAATGLITCLSAGSTTITALAKDGSGKKATLTIRVGSASGDEFALNCQTITIEKGDTAQLSAELQGSFEGANVKWASDNKQIATVTSDGLVTAKGSGTVCIRATANGYERCVTVTVPESTATSYRVLIAGEYTSSSTKGYLPFAVNCLVGVDSVLDLSNIEGNQYSTEKLNNPTSTELLVSIEDFFSDADDDDVSVIYLLSHGVNVNGEYRWQIPNGTYITEAQLTKALSSIDGDVVLVLVSCYAGEYLNDYVNHTGRLQGIVSTVNGYRKNGGKLSIITANNGMYTSCYTNKTDGTSVDFFSEAFCEALGWNLKSKKSATVKADANKDGKVTLLELAEYVVSAVVKNIKSYLQKYGSGSIKGNTNQIPQYYLTNPNLVIYSR